MSRGAILVLAALLTAPCGAEELGRLFFSPAERAALDAQRRASATRAEPAAPAPMRIDGYVLRAGGSSTVWVNGRASAGGPLPEDVSVTPDAGRPGEVAVTLRSRGASTRVKVGDTMDAASGGVRDVIGDSQVKVRR